MCRIHNPQATRAHRDVVSDHNKRIGNISSMQQARNQIPDGRFGAIPIDGDRYSAHLAPDNANIVKINVGR
jgi:hypothetical protein